MEEGVGLINYNRMCECEKYDALTHLDIIQKQHEYDCIFLFLCQRIYMV